MLFHGSRVSNWVPLSSSLISLCLSLSLSLSLILSDFLSGRFALKRHFDAESHCEIWRETNRCGLAGKRHLLCIFKVFFPPPSLSLTHRPTPLSHVRTPSSLTLFSLCLFLSLSLSLSFSPSSASAQYTTEGKGGRRLMMCCRVAVGNPKEFRETVIGLSAPPPSFDSVRGYTLLSLSFALTHGFRRPEVSLFPLSLCG